MNTSQIINILCKHYTLSELEDRLNLSTEDVIHGLEVYVEENYESIAEMLQEDLFFGN